MIGQKRLSYQTLAQAGVILVICFCAFEARAAELKIEARLIWGTNDEKFSNPKFKGLDKATDARMKKLFPWKRYFEVNRQETTIPARSSKRLQMSRQCTIDIKELEGPNVEVTLIGDGKKLTKATYGLSKGESFAIAGDCKDGSAWFVLITELDEK